MGKVVLLQNAGNVYELQPALERGRQTLNAVPVLPVNTVGKDVNLVEGFRRSGAQQGKDGNAQRQDAPVVTGQDDGKFILLHQSIVRWCQRRSSRAPALRILFQ